jgi:ribosomal protein S4
LLSLAGFKSSLGTGDFSEVCIYGRRKKEEGRRKKEEGRRKKEEEKKISYLGEKLEAIDRLGFSN